MRLKEEEMKKSFMKTKGATLIFVCVAMIVTLLLTLVPANIRRVDLTVGDIYDYVTAVRKLRITDRSVQNPSDITLYLKIDGRCIELSQNGEIEI